ncbi:hypothetical protein TNCV_1571581 [Trichonephila clavipes]|uniref:Uncharacterized protein n=1 Tax=Trichonephila clavipes TaxID=2585209 RepID=A0A8X6SKE9_TRICX|nr:hypothetical protein TNCV_1571581 [Trichonephila clavipes]
MLPNSTDKFRKVIVGRICHHRTCGRKPRSVDEKRDNSNRWEDNEPDERSGQTNKWIGRGRPVAWSSRSADINPLDFFWGHLKSLVWQALTVRIVIASADIPSPPDLFESVVTILRPSVSAVL